MAFRIVRVQHENYGMYAEQLQKVGATFADWLGWDEQTRQMKIDFATKPGV